MSILPRSSPWGAVQKCEELCEGVFEVSTAGHGGIMVRYAVSDFLSSEALKCAFRENRSFCFEEDCDAQIVLRELLDKGMWKIPDRITDKARYEDGINKSLQRWHPEYWEARQKSLSAQAPHIEGKEVGKTIDARKDIIFRDKECNVKFKIKDGESIKITVASDGEEVTRKCRFINNHHVQVGDKYYNIDEFVEIMAKLGNKYEPIPDQIPKLDIVLAEPGKPPREAQILIGLSYLNDIVGGQYEVLANDKFSIKVKGIESNIIAVCGLNNEHLSCLHPFDAEKHINELEKSIHVTADKKPTLAERLEVGKEKAAAHNSARETPDNPCKAKGETEH